MKAVDHQSESLVEVDRRLTNLLVRRQEREGQDGGKFYKQKLLEFQKMDADKIKIENNNDSLIETN